MSDEGRADATDDEGTGSGTGTGTATGTGAGAGRAAPDYLPDDGRRYERLGEPDPGWSVLESHVEYETGWYVGGYDLVEQPDGTAKRYYWAELATAVVVVAVADGRVVFVEQYRPTVRETQLELPAGIVERGESFTAAAERELREETGFVADGTALLQEFWACTGVLRHRRGIVFAEGLTPADPDPDDNEFLSVRAVPVDEALEMARTPPTNDATVEGLLLARDEGVL